MNLGIQIFIPGVPRNANARNQWARFAVNHDRQVFRGLTKLRASEIAIPDAWLPVQHVHISARRIATTRRRRDLLGLAEQLKPIMDGLVDAGMIIDDDEDHMRVTLLPTVLEPRATNGILLVLEPVL